jgi:voltage-gated potassium channel
MQGYKTRLKILLAALLGIMILGTIGFMTIEGRSLVDSAYFVIVTVATVGYGDVHPVTTLGKLFAVVLIITGVGTFLGVIANVTEIMLAKREIESRMEKLNMVIGVFFSEVGLDLLARYSRYDPSFDTFRSDLIVSPKWTDKDFEKASKDGLKHDYSVDMTIVDLSDLKSFFAGKRDFLVRLLENPVLMEHQSFTDLMRAAFHVAEELAYRKSFDEIPLADLSHLGGDIKRSYHLLAAEWIVYMKYLKNNYPFLFSLAVRTNPFDSSGSVLITDD